MDLGLSLGSMGLLIVQMMVTIHIDAHVWALAHVLNLSLRVGKWSYPEIQGRTKHVVSGWLGPQSSHLLFLSWSLYLKGKQLSILRPTGTEANCPFQMPRARCTPTLLSHSLSLKSQTLLTLLITFTTCIPPASLPSRESDSVSSDWPRNLHFK